MAIDANEFFEQCKGRWLSQRTTHHLAFRRSETGDSEIEVVSLKADDPKVVELCQFHQVEPQLAMGGAWVSWNGSMAWDRGDETHKGSTVMVLVPDDTSGRQGQLLRERGYAETAPVVGRFQLDAQDGLVLTTQYDTMTAYERFWFVSPTIRLRASTVQWFGGFSQATFCTETRIMDTKATNGASKAVENSLSRSLFGG